MSHMSGPLVVDSNITSGGKVNAKTGIAVDGTDVATASGATLIHSSTRNAVALRNLKDAPAGKAYITRSSTGATVLVTSTGAVTLDVTAITT